MYVHQYQGDCILNSLNGLVEIIISADRKTVFYFLFSSFSFLFFSPFSFLFSHAMYKCRLTACWWRGTGRNKRALSETHNLNSKTLNSTTYTLSRARSLVLVIG